MAKKTKKSENFESAVTELELLVTEMEQGEISLEDSLKKFERGIELTRSCQKALEEAEQKVQMLVEVNGKDKIEDYKES
ncbi:MAG: exodeoxyribonuclease VII small subunit [Gammaproteobacteria bacterium]|nr:exodeoxyribonuclease VII small subunit [Gammaproteobacteria bacterium]